MFVPVVAPKTESELVSMMSLLQAHDIPHYIHNRHFGALYPGPLIPLYNVRRVMVERTREADARELLAPFFAPPQNYETERTLATSDRIRVAFEFLFLGGWFLPFKWRWFLEAEREDT